MSTGTSGIAELAHVTLDKRQQQLFTTLQDFVTQLVDHQPSALSHFFGKNTLPHHGFYIYGGVGRGKTMIMDMIFNILPIERKRREHFHAFMLDVHARIHRWRQSNNGDPIAPIAKAIAKESWVLCLDELQVTDIGDAMILGRLFEQLFKHRVVLITTTNRPPDDLYKDGLQRDRFLPFIDLLKDTMEVFELGGNKDYRMAYFKSMKTTYFTPLGKKADKFLTDTMHELACGQENTEQTLCIRDRKVHAKAVCGDVAWFDFGELCEKPLGSADYIDIAREYTTVLLSDIPTLSKEKRNEAKRFVTLIDELYNHKVKLICTAAAEPKKIYPKGDGSFEFERTVSRLIEIQSEKYMKKAHTA